MAFLFNMYMSSFYDEFVQKVSNLELTTSTLVVFVKHAMEIVELSTLKGADQKKQVLTMIRKVVADSEDTDLKTTLLTMVDNGTVESTIDMIVSATKGELGINSEMVGNVVKSCGCF
tara:strand:- start:476 stop:826 length:351 start_codon:yes stop_codon:yes gene_type:complete